MSVGRDAEAREQLEAELMRVDGVLHAAFDARTGTDVWVVRDSGHQHGPVELAVRNRLADLGYDPAGIRIRVTLPTAPGPRRRVRFVSAERAPLPGGRVKVTVTLEWDDARYTGEATGESGLAIELKTTARAAIAALEALTGQSLALRIIGVKAIHAFDEDLMVASLYRSKGAEHRLVGAVLVTDEPLAAAAVAVLSAMNRTLGNFLHAPD
ncbi:MAG: hypothetical protein R3314_07415 [Longimicrobiales bacterium]|nr:hypothetical protein [Longimicrobiales bacterium]